MQPNGLSIGANFRNRGGAEIAKDYPSLGLDHVLNVARAFSAWETARGLGDMDWALAAVRSLGDSVRKADWRDARIVEMKLWEAEILLHRGQPEKSAKALAVVERRAGITDRSRVLAARIAYFANDLDGCKAACMDATVVCTSPARLGEIYRMWADALCQMEAYDEAWNLLVSTLPPVAKMTNLDIRALRQTVMTEAHLARFCGFMSPAFSSRGSRARAALYHYSMASRDLGLHARSAVAVRQRFLVGSRSNPFGDGMRAKVAKPGWVADATVALGDLRSAMQKARTPFFLISGTLLGCVRERDIIGHDKDIDVGVMETPDTDREATHKALAESGTFHIKRYQNPALLRVQHANGVMIDVFWHRIENGLVIHEGMKSKWWNSPFELTATEFLGDQYLIPKDYARYLSENYGDWKTPDPEFETFVDTPNMIVTSEHEMIWYYYCKLLDYYILGKAMQFRKVFREICRLRPDDHQIKVIGYRILAVLDGGTDGGRDLSD